MIKTHLIKSDKTACYFDIASYKGNDNFSSNRNDVDCGYCNHNEDERYKRENMTKCVFCNETKYLDELFRYAIENEEDLLLCIKCEKLLKK